MSVNDNTGRNLGSKGCALVVPDVTGLSNREAAHIYLDAGLMPHPWYVGRKNGKPTKISAYGDFHFNELDETHEDIDQWRDGWQCGLVTARSSGIIAADVDDLEAFQNWDADFSTDTVLSRTGRDRGYHLLFDGREVEEWPKQGNIPGGQVKTNGFIGVEPSIHPDGRMYQWGKRYVIMSGADFSRAVGSWRAENSSVNGSGAPGKGRGRTEASALRAACLAAGEGEQRFSVLSYVNELQMRGYDDDDVIELCLSMKLTEYKKDWPWDAGTFREMLHKPGTFYTDPSPRELAAIERELDGIGEAVEKRIRGQRKALDGYGVRTGDWLDEQEFPELIFAVPQIIVEGLTLLVGRPKVGKSILILKFALECARGGTVFGEECDQRDVRYLALEDGDRRMQKRCRQLLKDDPIPPGFSYQLKVKPGKLLKVIRAWLDEHPVGLVLVDTLGKVLEPGKGNETTYERDYRIVTAIKEVADDHPGSAIVVSHHARKASADDWLDTVSGTTAITGAPDSIIILTRKRAGQDGLLKITGRDVDEAEYALIKEMPTGWILNGADLLEAAGNAVAGHSNRGDSSTQILDFINSLDKGETATNAQVANATGLPSPRVNVHLSNLAKSGDIARVSPGVYGPVSKQKISKHDKE